MFGDDVVFMIEKDVVKCFSFVKLNWYYLFVDVKLIIMVIEKLNLLLK